jgi:hypothetical protein
LKAADHVEIVGFFLELPLRFHPAVEGQLMFVGLGLSQFFGNALVVVPRSGHFAGGVVVAHGLSLLRCLMSSAMHKASK